MNKLNPSPNFFVTLGDMVAGSGNSDLLEKQLIDFRSIVKYYCNPPIMLPIAGNHEVNNEPIDDKAEKIFKRILVDFKQHGKLENYNDTVYYMDTDKCRFMLLNSFHYREVRKIANSQLEWFKKACMAEKKFKIVFVHCPAYPTGAHVGSCLDLYKEDRDKFWKVIDENKIDIVFCGHEHNYSRRLIDSSFSTEKYKYFNNVYQITAGGGGEKLKDKFTSKRGVIVRPKAKYHFLVVDIDEDSIYVKAVSVDGKIIDKFEIIK